MPASSSQTLFRVQPAGGIYDPSSKSRPCRRALVVLRHLDAGELKLDDVSGAARSRNP
jgi:hypothetical protein